MVYFSPAEQGSFRREQRQSQVSQRIMSLTTEDILWYSRAYDDVNVILNCGNFPNVSLIGTKGGTNYNPRLALCHLGYPLMHKLDPEHVEEFVLYEGVLQSRVAL